MSPTTNEIQNSPAAVLSPQIRDIVDAVRYSLQDPAYVELIDIRSIFDFTSDQKLQLADAVVPLLCELLPGLAGWHLRRAFFILSALGLAAHAAVPALTAMLDHEDPEVVKITVDRLLKIAPDKDAILPVLLRVFQKKRNGFLINVLAEFGPKAAPAIPKLLTYLRYKRRRTRDQVARALIAIGPKGIAALIAAQHAACPATRENAVQALKMLELGEFDRDVPYIRFPELQTDLIDFAWMEANGAAVKHLVVKMWVNERFEHLSALGDALEVAGCTDEAILTHCRLPMTHSPDCWVLRAFLDTIRLMAKENHANAEIRFLPLTASRQRALRLVRSGAS